MSAARLWDRIAEKCAASPICDTGVFVTSTFTGGQDLPWSPWPVLKAGDAIGRLPHV